MRRDKLAGGYQLSAIRYQPSAISSQRSAVSDQWPAIGGEGLGGIGGAGADATRLESAGPLLAKRDFAGSLGSARDVRLWQATQQATRHIVLLRVCFAERLRNVIYGKTLRLYVASRAA